METGEEMGLAQYLLTKEARSKMYEMFDQLSQASKARIGRAGMLRSENQVMSGITRGNEALIKKHNIPVYEGSELQKTQGGYFSFGNNKMISELKSLDPTRQQVVAQHPVGQHFVGGSNMGLHLPSDAPTHKLNDPNGSQQFGKQLQSAGILNKPSDLKYADPHIKRHEINEYLDKVNQQKGLRWEGSKHVTRLADNPFTDHAPQAQIMDGGNLVGQHNSLGVLAKERKLAEGFSYTKGAQIMKQMRETTGENKLMSHIVGRDISTATLSPKEIKMFGNATPSQFGLHRRNPWTGESGAWDIKRTNLGTRNQQDAVFPLEAKKKALGLSRQHSAELRGYNTASNTGSRRQNFWEKGSIQRTSEKDEAKLRQARAAYRKRISTAPKSPYAEEMNWAY